VIVGDLKKMLEERTEPTMPPDQWPGVASMSVTVDTEFDGAELLGLAVAGPGYAAWTDQPWQHEVGQAIVAATNLVGHNVAVDLDHLVRRGYAHESWADGTHVRDTLLLHRMANENRTSYKLEDLAVDLLDLPPWKDETQELIQQGKIREIPREVLGARCRRDVWATDLLSRTPEVKKLDPGLIRFTTRVALACHRISLASAVVDMDRFEEMGLELRTEAEKHRELLFRVAKQHGMEAFSPTNDDNLRELLFDVLGLPSVRTTDKTGKPAVDKTSLTQVEELDETGAVGYLLQFNKWDKLLSTWYGKEGGKSVPLSRLIEPVGYVEGVPIGKLCFRLNPLGAKTGRRSSSRPNAQNWPESVRGIIRSRWPKGLILNADYKSLEVLLISWLSGEEKLFEYFNTGSGYLGVVKELFNMEVERGSEMYRLAKSLVLGMDYNMGKNKLADDLWYRANVRLAKRFVKHREEAGKLRDLYFSKFPKLKQYTQDRRDEILSSGQVTSLTGRVRRLPCPEGKFTDGFKRLWNQAVNFPVQSLASDVTGAAMVELEQGLAREHGLTVLGYYRMLLDQPAPHMRQRMSVLFNEVHDSLVVDVDPDRRDRDVELVVETMREAKLLRQLCPEFTLPLQVETTLAPEWGK
jgi:DNA polymerase I-like protein with 3'-5' exonuclease and polymerase domains